MRRMLLLLLVTNIEFIMIERLLTRYSVDKISVTRTNENLVTRVEMKTCNYDYLGMCILRVMRLILVIVSTV